MLSSWKWYAYHISSPCVLPLASLRSEELILKKSAWDYWLLWSSTKRCNTHAYQVSPPCVLQLASLRVILKKSACGYLLLWSSWKRCNACAPSFTSMCATISKFEEWRSAFKENSLRLFQTKCGRWKLYNRHTYQVTSLCVLPLESLRSEEVNLRKSAWGYLLLFKYCCNFYVGDW